MRILRRSELRNAALAGLAAALSIIALFLLLVVRTNNVQRYKQHVSDNCMAIEAIKTNIRQTLVVSRDRALLRDGVDASARAAIIANYQKELDRYSPIECPSP